MARDGLSEKVAVEQSLEGKREPSTQQSDGRAFQGEGSSRAKAMRWA